MKSLRVTWRPQAIDDIKNIFDWIETESGYRDLATQFVERIFALGESLGAFPEKGRQRDDLHKGLRILPFARRVIIAYRVINESVEITNVFYGGRNYEAILRDDDSER